MPVIVPRSKPRVWNVGPGLVAPEWRGLWHGLVDAVPLWEQGGDGFNYPRDRIATSGGVVLNGTTWVHDSLGGPALQCTSTGSLHPQVKNTDGRADLPYLSSYSFSVALLFRVTGVTNDDGFVTRNTTATGDLSAWGISRPTGSFKVFFGDTAVLDILGLGDELTDGDVHSFVVMFDDAAEELRVVADGSLRSLTTGVTDNPVNSTNGQVRLLSARLDGFTMDGFVYEYCFWHRSLATAEARQWTADPFGMFRLAPLRALKAAAGGITEGEIGAALQQPVFAPPPVIGIAARNG